MTNIVREERDTICIHNLPEPHCDKAIPAHDYRGKKTFKCIHIPNDIRIEDLPPHYRALIGNDL
jgi:hypothetical protein